MAANEPVKASEVKIVTNEDQVLSLVWSAIFIIEETRAKPCSKGELECAIGSVLWRLQDAADRIEHGEVREGGNHN